MGREKLQCRETASGLELPLHVQPRARRTGITGLYNGALKVKITAPPVDDAANRAVIEYFSGLLGLSKSQLEIVAGARSRTKTLKIRGCSRQTLESLVAGLEPE
jgi:uncharacterized protein (TIGR00251 family)